MTLDRRESVMLAHIYNRYKHNILGWYASEKMDGMRAFWDGSITRGLPVDQVPFANIDKHERYRNQLKATGLWTRYYQPIQAPDWFLDQLPTFPLDGELYAGIGKFQQVMSTCKKLVPITEEWNKIKYVIFDIPSLANFLLPGRINIPSFTKIIEEDNFTWAKERIAGNRPYVYNFDETYDWLINNMDTIVKNNVDISLQTEIQEIEQLDLFLEEVTNKNGEGLILRKPNSHWTPKRSHDLLKVKKYLDSEGIVLDYVWGLGKLEGLMGAMLIQWHNTTFELSGFTDDERRMEGEDRLKIKMPGLKVGPNVFNPLFPRGSKISFKYQDLSNDGIPRHARYFRKR